MLGFLHKPSYHIDQERARLAEQSLKSSLRYVGGIAGFKVAKNLLEPWDITTLSALAWMMKLQHIEII
jgi:hypothetical protein